MHFDICVYLQIAPRLIFSTFLLLKYRFRGGVCKNFFFKLKVILCMISYDNKEKKIKLI